MTQVARGASLVVTLLCLVCWSVSGCSESGSKGSGDGGTDMDVDVDTDTDSDSDTETDSETYQDTDTQLVIDADWEIVTMSPGMFVNDIHMLDDGLVGYAVGGMTMNIGESLSLLLRTADGGQTWEDAPLADPTFTGLNGVSFVDAATGWVAGDNGALFKTEDGGDSWVQQEVGTTYDLMGVSFVDASTGWVCDNGTTFDTAWSAWRTTDGGETWTDLSFGSAGHDCVEIQFIDASTGWIAVRESDLTPHVFRTDDGGDSWVQETSLPPGIDWLNDFSFADADVGFAVGSTDPAGMIIKTEDGGDTWAVVGETGLWWNDAVDCQDTQRCALATFDLGDDLAEVWVTENGGETWASQALPMAMYMPAIQHVGDSIWIGSDLARIITSSNSGQTWEFVHYSPMWGSIAWRDDDTGWVSSGSQVFSDGYARRSDDGGETWEHEVAHPGGRFFTLVDSSTGFAFFPGDDPPIYRTGDGGDSWEYMSTASGGWYEGFFFASPQRGWVFGGFGDSSALLKRTDDGGASFSTQALGVGMIVSDVHFVDEQEGFAICGAWGEGHVFHTENGGDDWTAITPSVTDHYLDVSFLNPALGFVGAVNGRIYRTVDGGESFELVVDTGHYTVQDILVLNSQNAWVAIRNGMSGSDARGFVYRTADGGDSWIQEWASPWIDNSINDLALSADGNTLWAAGANETILRRQIHTE